MAVPLAVSSTRLDWSLCIFCQKSSRNKTICPGLSKKIDAGVGYKTLSEMVDGYKVLGSLPTDINFALWDEGDGIEDTLRKNNACFHKHCRSLIHPTKLARQRQQEDIQENSIVEDSSFNPSEDMDATLPKQARFTRSVSGLVDINFSSLCFLCEKEGKDLRKVMTKSLSDRVRQCAEFLKDHTLLAKLTQGNGDLIAIEAQYHPPCLVALYNRACRMPIEEPTIANEFSGSHLSADSLALSEVVSYMEDMRCNQGTPPVFKLSLLIDLYNDRLKQHGGNVTYRTHATRFKDRLLALCSDVTAVHHGREVLLTFNENLGIALSQIKDNSDSGAIHLMHTAKLIRQELFAAHSTEFNGSFDENSQKDSIPQTLVSLIGMLLEGPGNVDASDNQAALSIAQLIKFNAVKRPRKSLSAESVQMGPIVRHSLSQETPLPIYLGIMLHAATRKKKLVDKCFKLGLSVCYDRVKQIITKLGNSICAQYTSDQIVCPPNLHSNLFTVAAVDNIDHNTSSNTAKGSFHGTAISLMQFPEVSNLDATHSFNYFLAETSSDPSEIVLPLTYSDVPPCVFPKKDPIIPKVEIILNTANSDTMIADYQWLNEVLNNYDKNVHISNITWASYHAHMSHREPKPSPIIAMMPLFRHSAHTVAMIRHSMTIVQAAIQKLNPSQVPVVTFDQPLYALAKEIQWHWPEKFGEDKFVVMMGGLHIEMAALRMLGHWLDGSGWVQCLVNAGIATAGIADSFIQASHVKCTRYAHLVTTASLYISLQRCYSKYCEGQAEENHCTFEQWRLDRCKTSTLFNYWNTLLEMQLTVLGFIRSIREPNLNLYIQSLRNLAPWFFSLDQTNYARWMSVHLRDMQNLEINHPNIYAEFQKNNFTVSKTDRHFSNISIDQAHEQLNALIKGDGGIVGLTESDNALNRWTIAGPETLRIIEEFENNLASGSCQDRRHHEQTPACQKRYIRDITNLLEVLEEYCCPFSETTTDDLIALDSHIVADKSVYLTVKNAFDLGTSQLEKFFKDRFVGSVSIQEPLPRNKLPLFTFKPASKKRTANQLKVAELKTDCQLFSRLYIACQARAGDLKEFFSHENQACPPSLSQHGTLRFGTKSDLLACFNSVSCSQRDIADLEVDTYVLDGAVAVQMLQPGCSRTFEEYGYTIFIPYITSVLSKVNRLDIVFDIYLENSLKAAMRLKRGSGTKTRISANTKVPKNWQDFMRVDDNKTELFHYLADLISLFEPPPGKVILVTRDERVKCSNGQVDISKVDLSNHEEADTRLILHCAHAAENGSRKVSIRTVDTDVVVLAISYFGRLNLVELWVHFGVGRNVRLISVHDLSKALGPEKCLSLPAFHSLTGCDTTSSFGGKGKKSAWEAWTAYPVVTQAFLNLFDDDSCFSESTIAVLERFIIIMYDRTSECTDLDTARMHLFTKKSRSLELLPPTSDAFLQHVKRAVLQGIHCWGHCLEKQMHLRKPEEWGWIKDADQFVPLWMEKPEVAEVCRELLKCACKKGCFARCKCVKANLVCTALCQCDGECQRK